MDLELAGTVALVTGAGTGIGRASAVRLAAEGAAVALVGRRRDVLEDTARAVRKAGGRATVLPGDVSDVNEPYRLVTASVAEFGRLDHLVSAAGGADRPGAVMDDEHWAHQFELNLHSRRRIAEAAMPHLRESGRGRIVSFVGILEPAAVSAAQAAVAACILWSKALSHEVAPHGVTVNCIAPGRIDSEQVALFHPDEESRRLFSQASIPAGRFGEPDEAAAVVAFLCSRVAGYVTGETVRVDGGMHRGI